MGCPGDTALTSLPPQHPLPGPTRCSQHRVLGAAGDALQRCLPAYSPRPHRPPVPDGVQRMRLARRAPPQQLTMCPPCPPSCLPVLQLQGSFALFFLVYFATLSTGIGEPPRRPSDCSAPALATPAHLPTRICLTAAVCAAVVACTRRWPAAAHGVFRHAGRSTSPACILNQRHLATNLPPRT